MDRDDEMRARRIGDALAWIVALLDQHRLPYQVVGGLAAQAYGAQRPLVDIDLYAPLVGAQAFLDAVQPFTARALAPYADDRWRLAFLKLVHAGQPIEIGDTCSRPQYFDRQQGCWVDQVIDFARSVPCVVYGVSVSMMPKQELIAYKAALGRDVDQLDLADLLATG